MKKLTLLLPFIALTACQTTIEEPVKLEFLAYEPTFTEEPNLYFLLKGSPGNFCRIGVDSKKFEAGEQLNSDATNDRFAQINCTWNGKPYELQGEDSYLTVISQTTGNVKSLTVTSQLEELGSALDNTLSLNQTVPLPNAISWQE